MPRCIYCLEAKPSTGFNREHVLPEGFGKFRDSPVLHETVCADCNAYFGKTLDLALGRSSSEGLERYAWNVKPASEVDRFRYGEVVIRLDAPGTDWHEALVRRIPTGELGETGIELLPQAIFQRRDGSGVVHVPEWDIRSGKWRTDDRIDPAKGIRILAVAEQYDQVKDALAEQGIRWQEEHQLEPPPAGPNEQATVRHEFVVFDDLKRALAKLSFNYLAYIYRHRREVALDPAFDPIRTYIRYGAEPEFKPVWLVDRSRLGNTRPDGTVPVVHYFTLELDRTGKAVLGHVTLFHWAVYMVLLTAVRPSSIPLVGSGHLYNISDRRCYRLNLERV